MYLTDRHFKRKNVRVRANLIPNLCFTAIFFSAPELVLWLLLKGALSHVCFERNDHLPFFSGSDNCVNTILTGTHQHKEVVFFWPTLLAFQDDALFRQDASYVMLCVVHVRCFFFKGWDSSILHAKLSPTKA